MIYFSRHYDLVHAIIDAANSINKIEIIAFLVGAAQEKHTLAVKDLTAAKNC